MPRSAYESVFATLQPLAGGGLRYRADQLARVFTDRGVTFAYAGEERPFPLDLVPRIVDAYERPPSSAIAVTVEVTRVT